MDLAGTASALGEALFQVKWTNLLNQAGGLANGTDHWSVKGIPLKLNATNIITLTASTVCWAPGLGGNTTFSRTLLVARAREIQAAIALAPSGFTLNWTGGVGPFRIQQSLDLAKNTWLEAATNAISPLPLPRGPGPAFYRIIGN